MGVPYLMPVDYVLARRNAPETSTGILDSRLGQHHALPHLTEAVLACPRSLGFPTSGRRLLSVRLAVLLLIWIVFYLNCYQVSPLG
jgi:hypothetical protein